MKGTVIRVMLERIPNSGVQVGDVLFDPNEGVFKRVITKSVRVGTLVHGRVRLPGRDGWWDIVSRVDDVFAFPVSPRDQPFADRAKGVKPDFPPLFLEVEAITFEVIEFTDIEVPDLTKELALV